MNILNDQDTVPLLFLTSLLKALNYQDALKLPLLFSQISQEIDDQCAD